jgi:hypothetical protein
LQRGRIAARAHRALAAFDTLRLLVARGALWLVVAVRALVTAGTVVASGTVIARRTVVTLEAVAVLALPTRLALSALLVLAIAIASRRGALLVVAILVAVRSGATALVVTAVVIFLGATDALVLLLEARTAFLEHAEIMVGELKIIFGLDPVARQLHVAGKGLVLFEQLRGIAALAIVLAIAIRTSGNTLGTLSTATATAAALTIIDQESCFPVAPGRRVWRRPIESFPAMEKHVIPSRRPARASVAQVDPPLPFLCPKRA